MKYKPFADRVEGQRSYRRCKLFHQKYLDKEKMELKPYLNCLQYLSH